MTLRYSKWQVFDRRQDGVHPRRSCWHKTCLTAQNPRRHAAGNPFHALQTGWRGPRPRLTQIPGHRRGEACRLSGDVAVATMRSDLSGGAHALSPSMASRDHDHTSSHHFHSAWSLTLRGHQGQPRDHTQACRHPRCRWGYEHLRERVAYRAPAHVTTTYTRSPYPQLEPVMTQPQNLFIPADAGEKVTLPGIEITIKVTSASTGHAFAVFEEVTSALSNFD